MTLELNWPPSVLWPNGRAHWAVKNRAKRVARDTAYWVTRAAPVVAVPDRGAIPVRLTFCPPTKRRYDLDNALAACKAALDGVAEALVVDDVRFAPVLVRGDVCKGGKVVVEIGVTP